jgi:spermidine synthase/predicted MFS family arabinose efflux permease
LSPVDSLRQERTSRQKRSWPQIYFGVAVTTLASLLLELSLTRIFSVVFYYHFAFLAISIALFGLGVGGVFSYVVAGWPGSLYGKLGVLAIADAVAVVFALEFLLTRPAELTTLDIGLVYCACALPFLLSGTVVASAISDTIDRVDRAYFFDLMGAAGGCALLVPFLNWIGGPGTLLVSAALFAVSAAVWFNVARLPRGRIIGVSIALALVALITYNSKNSLIDLTYAKGRELKNEEFHKWNSFSRVALTIEPGSGTRNIIIDGDAETGVANFNFSRLTAREREYLAYQGPGFPYLLRPGAKTLVIGPGGGWDVARALASGSKDVTGVEINPIIADLIMRKKFPQYSQYLYYRPDVHLVIEDGRSYVRRTSQRFQVLQATLVDTWASTAAGAFALSENSLYTTNAFRDYLNHLTGDGIMAFTRWGFKPPRESLRIVALARQALEQIGEPDAARNVIVVREGLQKLNTWGAQDTILISRRPFSSGDIDRVKEAVVRAGMESVYLPGTDQPSAFRDLLLAHDPGEFYANYPFDVRPVTDNRPFFFYTVQPRDVWHFLTSASNQSEDYKINTAVPLLFGLLLVSLVATLIVLALPPVVLGDRLSAEPGAIPSLVYFLCIGAGYILIQVALIQKFILFLGHPTYALTVIIFSMLVSSGLGSFVSRRLVQQSMQRLTGVFLFIAAGVALLSLVITPVTEGGVALPFEVKAAIAVVLIAPVGFAMGMPFPCGLNRLEKIMPQSVRWAWSINAAASVLGSAGAVVLAIYCGLSNTLLIGGLLYVAALAAALLSPLGKKYTISGAIA